MTDNNNLKKIPYILYQNPLMRSGAYRGGYYWGAKVNSLANSKN